MFKRFGQIFWGLLLVILDFNLNRIDALPDVLGYLLVVLGCRGVSGVVAVLPSRPSSPGC